jgi:hypothetical protein
MKPSFLTKPFLRPMVNRRWELSSDLIWRNGHELNIVVPSSFKSDLASVPRVLWSLFPPYGSYTYAAILHDWLYTDGKLSRVECDAIFIAAMKSCGTSWVTRSIIYSAVRMFGWVAFNQHASKAKSDFDDTYES